MVEWWSGVVGVVLFWIFGDPADPIFVVAFLFKLCDQPQQTIFDLVMQNVEVVKALLRDKVYSS